MKLRQACLTGDSLATAFRFALGCGLVTLVMLAVGACSARGADDDVLRELQARMDAMERQNQALLKALRAKQLVDQDPDDSPGDLDDSEELDATPIGELRFAADSSESADDKPPDWYEIGSDLKMMANWKNGLEVESKNHDFRVHIGGRVQFDVGWYHPDESVQQSLPITNKFRDGVDFRRGRFRIDGTMYETMEWTAEFDFVNSAGAGTPGSAVSVVAPTDLWWQWNEIPILQHFRAGNVKEPIGFEHLTSSRFLNFMERSFLQDAFFGGFNNGFTPGGLFFGNTENERATYAIGMFDITTNVFGYNSGPSEYSWTGRLTALPYYENDGRGLIHLGISGKHWLLDEDSARFRTRASVRSSASTQWPVIADTGLLFADTNQQLNTELVGVFGPLSFAAEYLTSWLQETKNAAGQTVGTVFYQGGYVEALYFLTGETRAYNRKTAVFDRVVPFENAFFVRGENGETSYGWGAWQIAARFQYLNLNSLGFNGGVLRDTTLGINWFLNPNFKVQANYFYLDREGPNDTGNGAVQGFGIRLAHDF